MWIFPLRKSHVESCYIKFGLKLHLENVPCFRISVLTHLCRPLRSTFAVRETASLGIMGEPEAPPLCQETQSLGQQMLERWEQKT